MDITLTLASKLASMMLIVVVGFVIVRVGLLKRSDSRPFSLLTVYVLQPCLIVSAFQIELTKDRLAGFLAVLVFSTLVYLVWVLAARLLRKPLHLDEIMETTLIYSNVGNLILPLVSLMFGQEMVFYASAIQLPFNLFIWTHGASIVRGEKHFNPARILLNPNLLAVIAGLLLMLLQIRIPDIPETAVSGLSSMVGPTSMLVIGMVIADSDLKSVFLLKKAYFVLLGRLIIFPLAAMGLLWASGFLRRYPQYVPMLQVAFMSLSAPPSSTISQLAVVHNKKPLEASIYNVMGTLFCILTIPLVIACYQALFA